MFNPEKPTVNLKLLQASSKKSVEKCGWCDEVIPSNQPRFFLSDAPVVDRVFFHENCGKRVLSFESEKE
jgi:hypothetical protein